jgi:hypothetical protein
MGQVEDYAEPEPGAPALSLVRLALIVATILLAAGLLFALFWFMGGEEAWYST